tara:strand:- start:96 stop:380 length:285 start_codon:yes stop_codon:yes gene_type:complete
MNKQILSSLNREEMKFYLFEIQDIIASHLQNGGDVDSFIDETDLLDDFEDILPDEEYGIFVITLLNGIRSETVINTLLDSLLKGIQPKATISSI